MKEFMKKCPFVCSLLMSGIFVLNFYIVDNNFLNLWLEKPATEVTVNIEGNASEGENPETEENIEKQIPGVEQDPLIKQNKTDAGADSLQNGSGLISDTELNEENQKDTELNEENQRPDAAQEKTDSDVAGVTEFISYEPTDVKSPYYKDTGKKALTTRYPYQTVDVSYFRDAAFIGDSRTIGLFDYAGFEGADFYADNGFCAYLWKKKGSVTLQNTHKKVDLAEALSQRQYGKIYLMVGMNDCGYGTTETFQADLEEMLQMIEERQPNAIIFLPAIMNVTKEKSETQDLFTKTHINAKNVAIAECANGVNRFYLDYNALYEDEEGYLRATDSFDGIHLYGSKYGPWIQFFLEHGIVKGEKTDVGDGSNTNQ